MELDSLVSAAHFYVFRRFMHPPPSSPCSGSYSFSLLCASGNFGLYNQQFCKVQLINTVTLKTGKWRQLILTTGLVGFIPSNTLPHPVSLTASEFIIWWLPMSCLFFYVFMACHYKHVCRCVRWNKIKMLENRYKILPIKTNMFSIYIPNVSILFQCKVQISCNSRQMFECWKIDIKFSHKNQKCLYFISLMFQFCFSVKFKPFVILDRWKFFLLWSEE